MKRDAHDGKGQPSNAGMFLVELLVAIFVLVAAGSGILGCYLSTNYLSEEAAQTLKASEDLKDLMERIQATPFNTVLTLFPDGIADGGGVSNYQTIVGNYSLPSEQITVTYPTQEKDRLEVLVSVAWTQRGRQRSLASSTLKTSG